MHDVQALVDALKRAAHGENLTDEEVRAIRFSSPAKPVQKLAEQSWRRLVHFLGDLDIRSRDASYDDQMKQEMSWRAQELTDLASAKDAPPA